MAKKEMQRRPGIEVRAKVPKASENTDRHRMMTLGAANTVAMKRTAIDNLSQLTDSEALNALFSAGVGSKYLTCQLCGYPKVNTAFYRNYDPRSKTGYCCVCKECLFDIANQVDVSGRAHGVTKQSIIEALEYADKPFLTNIYDNVTETDYNKDSRAGKDMWTRYITNLSLNKKLKGLRFRDSDINVSNSAGYTTFIKDTPVNESDADKANSQEQYEINRRDTIKFCGYDPFLNEKERDKPRLYAMLVGFLDDQAKEDPFKLSSIIEIVKGLSQSEKLNDEITNILNDATNLLANSPTLNKMMDTRKKCLDSVQQLARDNGISINYNKNSSAGQQTLSGRIKKLTEEGLREAKVNFFDQSYCDGMRQVAEISESARQKQLGMSEDIVREINMARNDLVKTLTEERDTAREQYRLMRQENNDLKDYLRAHNLIDENNEIISNI